MVSEIVSVHNERVKHIRSLARRRVRHRVGRFVIEGARLVDEAARAGLAPALVLYTQSWEKEPEGQRLLPWLSLAQEGAWPATEGVLAHCSDTITPQGVLAVVPMIDLPARPGIVLILDQLRDPGNLGTILRSAEAVEVGQIILTPGTVDLYNPKVVRAGMGAHFRLPVKSLLWPEISEAVAGRKVWLADAAQGRAHDKVEWALPSALIVGGEAAGASDQAAQLATGRVNIPMSESTESLNAAMAATVILFEAARQGRQQPARR